MFEKMVLYHSATITLRRATVRSRLQARAYLYKLTLAGLDDRLYIERYNEIELFIRFATQATVSGDLGFALAKATDDPTAVMAALDAFLDAPGNFFDAVIRDGLETVDSPITADAQQPGETVDPKNATPV